MSTGNVLTLGSGLVAKPGAQYLAENGFNVVVASRNIKSAENLVAQAKKDSKNENLSMSAAKCDVEKDDEILEKLVIASDYVISLLPYIFHVKVAKLAIKHKKNFFTTSYVSDEMKGLQQEALDAGIILLNECGVDPGTDHMSAMRIIDKVHAEGGKIEHFTSYCFEVGTKVFMFDGSVKKIEDITVNDLVLGHDSNSCEVTKVSKGFDSLYEVKEITNHRKKERIHGLIEYVCNSEHILSLYTPVYKESSFKNDFVEIRKRELQKDGIVRCCKEKINFINEEEKKKAETYIEDLKNQTIYWEISVSNYVANVSGSVKLSTYQKSVPITIERKLFENTAEKVGIEKKNITKLAWIFGVWMADGSSKECKIAVNIKDVEEIERIQEYCNDLDLVASDAFQSPSQTGSLTGVVSIKPKANAKFTNKIWNFIKEIGLGRYEKGSEETYKKIPSWLSFDEVVVREWFLAGLIDSVGHNRKDRKCVEIKTIYKGLCDGLISLSRSLGIKTTCSIEDENTDKWNVTHKLHYIVSLSYCPILNNILSKCSVANKKMENVENVELTPSKIYFTVDKSITLVDNENCKRKYCPRDLITNWSDDNIRLVMKINDNFGYSFNEIAQMTNSKQSSVSNYLRKITLKSKVRQSIEKIIFDNWNIIDGLYQNQLENYEERKGEYVGITLKGDHKLFQLANSCQVHNCGGLPKPEDNDNPFGYKLSWAPRGVLLASRNDAYFLENGKDVKIEGKDLFDNYKFFQTPIGEYEGYPNRNSKNYIDIYGIPEVQTIVRGTFRNKGWCRTIKKIADLGLLSVDEINLEGKTYQDLMESIVGNSENLKEKVSEKVGLKSDDEVINCFEWIGLLSSQKIPSDANTKLDALCHLFKEKLVYKDGQRDMLLMQHCFTAKYENKTEKITCSLVDYGIKNSDTSMSRTVSLPVSICVKLVATGKVKLTGLQTPVIKELYNPILDELESMGIKFIEEFITVKE